MTTHHYLRACPCLRCPCIESKQFRAFTQISSNFFLAKASRQLFSWEGTGVQSASCVWLLATSWLQHTRFLCPSPSPWVCPSSCPVPRWCHPAIPSFVIPFSFCPHSSLASGTFPMSWLFPSKYIPTPFFLDMSLLEIPTPTFYCGCFFSHKIFHFLL